MWKMTQNRRFWFQLSFWVILSLLEFGVPDDFHDFLRADFWLKVAVRLLGGIAGLAVCFGIFYGYSRFCLWFGRAIDRAHARIASRVAAREGALIWPASDPLHDPELDA